MTIFRNISIVFSILLITGCTTIVDRYVYVDVPCPKIKVLQVVPVIDGNVTNGCVCDNQLTDLLRGTSDLRKSESYYIDELTTYNKEFTEPIDK